MPRINLEQVEKVAKFVKFMSEDSKGLDFFTPSDLYPSLNHPEAINFFFFACLHQYGFWYGDVRGYVRPLFGTIGGKHSKGSDLLFQALKKAFNKDPLSLDQRRLAFIGPSTLFFNVLADDNGSIPFPDLEERFKMTRAYGLWFAHEGITPSNIIAEANHSKEPLRYFLEQVCKIDGYNRDRLEKRNLLLAMILANRPEKFLVAKDTWNWAPIIDNHLMRLALRWGLVDLDEKELATNKLRLWVDSQTEEDIRTSVYFAVEHLIRKSGRTMSFLDEKMWNARDYCPEMTKPDCAKCIFNEVCKKRVELFQPIFRTTAY